VAYNDTPLASQRIKDTQAPIRSNFLSIQTAESVNHVPIEDPSGNQGKHKYLQIPDVQGSNVATALGEVAVFTKTGLTAVPALFFRGQSNATVPSGGFTEYQGGPGSAVSGWTRLASGILLKWAFVAPSLPNPGTVTFPVGATIPVFTDVFQVQLTMFSGPSSDPNTFVYVLGNPTPPNTVGFRVWQTARTTANNTASQFYYLAIGV
jgi:hypothetical protein